MSRHFLFSFAVSLAGLCWPLSAAARMVEYALEIGYVDVNITGRPVRAMGVNGGIPGPTLAAEVGDMLRITVHNRMDVPSSVHWHGVLLPNSQDGVPYLTGPPIAPGTSHVYEFRVRHAGTYWYHSHVALQEQRGVFGALVFHPAGGEAEAADREQVVIFSDWTDEEPEQVAANLRRDGHYYALQKGSVQSWGEALRRGRDAWRARFMAARTRMGPMDISDIAYARYLANGAPRHQLIARAGEWVRLRLINAAAASYFSVEFAGGPMVVLAADGVDVVPLRVQRLRMAIAETYDVLVQIPAEGAWELRATAEDGSGHASALLGSGALHAAPDMPRPDLFARHHQLHGGQQGSQALRSRQKHKDDRGDNRGQITDDRLRRAPGGPQQAMEMQSAIEFQAALASGRSHAEEALYQPADFLRLPVLPYLENYAPLKARRPTALSNTRPERRLRFALTGDMERYVWSFDNRTFTEAEPVMVREGERVQMEFVNETMMDHPIHLHGHFFRVLNGQDAHSPLKHTVNVPALQSVTIEFAADESRDWLMHCHILYHMRNGMSRIVAYEGSSRATPEIIKRMSEDDRWYRNIELGLGSSALKLMARAYDKRHALELEYQNDWNGDYEAEALYHYRPGRYLSFHAGATVDRADGASGRKHDDDEKPEPVLGIAYLLPLLVEAKLRVEGDTLELGLGASLMLTNRLEFSWHADTDDEYSADLHYIFTPRVRGTILYHSDFGTGVGLEIGW